MNVPKLDRDPNTVHRLYNFKDFDFRLKPGSAAVDRGIVLANVNDGFTGKAPGPRRSRSRPAVADLRLAAMNHNTKHTKDTTLIFLNASAA